MRLLSFMLLDDDVADFGLKSSGTATKVKDHLTLVKLDFLIAILGNDTDELANVLTIFENKVATVAQGVGVIGHIRILIDLNGCTTQLHVGGDGHAHVIGLTLLDVQGYTSD